MILGKGSGGDASAKGGSKPWQRGKPPPSAVPCDPAVLAALRAIYAEHVPEKTSSDVEAILGRFAGREAVLLRKVRAKYLLVEAAQVELEAAA